MDITQLKAVIHVAELGSLSKAADRLNISQPALSRQIRLLEQELGVYLFERHGRGMIITEPARLLLDHAGRIMQELDAIRSSVAGSGSSFRGVVTVGMTPTVASFATVSLVRSIRDQHPDLAIRLASAFSGYLLDWVQRGEVDVAVSYNPQPLKSLRITPVMEEDLLLVGISGLDLKKPVPFARLESVPLILPSPRHGLRLIMDDCARRAGIEFDASLEADSFESMIDLVRNGFGSTVLPLAPIHKLLESGDLCAAPIADPAPMRTLVLAYSADRAVTPAARFVGRVFLQIAEDFVSRGIWAGRILPGADADLRERRR